MVKSRRVFTREFKLAAIKELESGKPLGLVSRQVGSQCEHTASLAPRIQRTTYESVSGQGRRVLAESHEAELERKIGQLTMENDFLKNERPRAIAN
jgi:transposase-like protein